MDSSVTRTIYIIRFLVSVTKLRSKHNFTETIFVCLQFANTIKEYEEINDLQMGFGIDSPNYFLFCFVC